MWILALLFSLGLSAEETELNTLRVIGDEEFFILDEPVEVSDQTVKESKQTDSTKTVKKVAGVYVRQEDGYGLRPNVGLRGTNPDRSKKVVLLEDGLLIAPAPYSAPAAYYHPTMLRVGSIDIMKGFFSTQLGPNSIGGAINYNSRPIPFQRQNDFESSWSSYNTAKLRLTSGGQASGTGYMINAAILTSDGFKTLRNNQTTGFAQQDFLLKLKERLSANQTMELRLGYGEETSNETYLGVSPLDFSIRPFERYMATANDQMKWQHRKIQLVHQAAVRDNLLVETTFYNHQLDRTWFRFDGFANRSLETRQLLLEPTELQRQYLEILRGDRDSSTLGLDGDMFFATNERTYFSRGLQSQWTHINDTGATINTFNMTFRYHEDQINSTPTHTRYSMEEGELRTTAQQPFALADDTVTTDVRFVSLTNSTEWSRLTVMARGRFEDIRSTSIRRLSNLGKDSQVQVAVPGVSVGYRWLDSFATRFSANQAVTVAGVARESEDDLERANNYELELKYQPTGSNIQWQNTFFVNDYDNLTGSCTASAGCATIDIGKRFSAGAAKIQGLESQVAMGRSWGRFWFPIQLSYTYLDARFQNDFVSESREWGVGAIEKDTRLPDIPQQQFQLNVGMEWGAFSQSLLFGYQSDFNDQATGDLVLTIPAYGTIDWLGTYRVSRLTQVYASIQNLTDKHYVVASKPFGLRAGQPRFVGLGLQSQF